ncbi:MAG: hypothetical protein Q4D62_04550 [Planctomycetia bacterium]|nr:hypothetical protein [Planctomycetia bacterium]
MYRRLFLALILWTVSHATWGAEWELYPLNDFCADASGLTLTPWGDVLISVPNFGDTNRIAMFIRLHEKQLYLWGISPVSPASGRGVPAGIVFGEDENLYICDNQNRVADGQEGRILRVLVNSSHRPYAAQLVASGLQHPHRIAIFGEHLYVTQYFYAAQESSDVWQSSLYRFPIHVENIPVTPLPDDPSLLHTFPFTNPEKKQLPLSLCFDPSGKLYVGNPAEGAIYHVTFDEKGKVREVTEYLRASELTSIDGMAADGAGNLYIGNASLHTIFRITPAKTIEPFLRGEEVGFRQPQDICWGEGVLYFTCRTLESTPAVGLWRFSEAVPSSENAAQP